MTTTEAAPRLGTAARERIAWACWAAWAIAVATRIYVRLWEAFHHPADLASILRGAFRESLACTILGGAAVLIAAASVLAWRAVHARTGGRAAAPALLAAAVLALLWFRAESTFVTRLSALHGVHFPAIGEAAARATRGLCGAALVTLASWAAGGLVVRPIGLGQARAEERHVLALTLGCGILAYASAAMAWAGIYRPPLVALLISLLLGAGALARPRRARDTPDGDARPHLFPRVKPPTTLDTVWLALAFLALSFAFVAALAPETEYDALWYHLNLPRLWLDAGRPIDLIQEYPSLYPMTWELVYGAALVMGGAVAAKLLHFGCLLVLAATLVIACRRYAPECSPYAAVGLFVTAPTMLWEASTAYNDLAIAMFAAVACYALARYAETGDSPWLTASALEFGLAAATKHLGLVVLAVAAALLLWASQRKRVPWRRAVHAVFVISAAALVLALPWYVRAWRGSGNPFFPELYGVFGGGPPARWDGLAERGLAGFKAHFGRGHNVTALLRLPWDMTVHAAMFGGSFGPLWLMLVPACLIGKRRSRTAFALALGALAYVCVWASPASSLQLRFLVPAGGAIALLAAVGWQRVIGPNGGIHAASRRVAGSALLGVATLSLPPFTALQETDRRQYEGWLTHVLRASPVSVVTGRETEAQYLATALPSWAVWQYANLHLPPDAAVLTFSAGDNFYSRRTRFSFDSVLARPAVWTAVSDAQVVAALRDLGVEFVIFDRRLLPQLQADHLPIADDAMQSSCVTLYQDRHYRLCRLTSVSAAMPRRGAAAPASLP